MISIIVNMGQQLTFRTKCVTLVIIKLIANVTAASSFVTLVKLEADAVDVIAV